MSSGRPQPLSSIPEASTHTPRDELGMKRSAGVTGADRWLTRKLLAALGDPPLSFVLWDGETVPRSPDGEFARIGIGDRMALFRLVTHPQLQFGDLYSSGRVTVDGDLVRALELVFRANLERDPGAIERLINWLRVRGRSRSIEVSRENIHHHYDLGNEFYALWLDTDALQYTCAYFPQPAMTLEQAQRAKMHHVCRKLWLEPGESVVEAGFGWGGLALFMAREYGVTVRAYNTSHEQVVYARERARNEGLVEQVEFIEDDYRNIRGDYDVFVSVGMLEHVGPEHYAELCGVIDRCLRPDGRGLVHSIGRHRPGPMNAWIERRIFPGGYPPTLGEMMPVFEPRFSVLDVENLRLHYAKTLEHWAERFERNAETVRSLYDERFVRAWRLYLAGSIAAFRVATLHLFQVLFARPRLNDLPWSRARLHGDL
jgi:cyclopropane-fatty-acyl-phospholipid synthase